MAVDTTNAFSGPFIPNGATTTFPFTFTAPGADEVDVVLRAADGSEALATGYVVTLNPNGGGSVTFDVAPAAGPELFIMLEPRFTQQIKFENGTGWIAEPVNEAADRAASRDQVLRRDIGRAQLMPLGEAPSVLPPAAVRAGRFRAWDGAGDETLASGTGNDAAFRTDWADPAIGGRLGAFEQAGAGSVLRSIYGKLVEQLSAADKGADPTGVVDSTIALQNLFADMATTGRANLLSGRYKVTGPLLIPPGAIEGGDVTFDFSEADPADFGEDAEYACVRVAGGARTQIANLSVDLVIGDRRMVFVAAHGLSVGDTFNLAGTVEWAGNGWRYYYTKGEMFRVAAVVNATTVETEGACRDTYAAADVEVWKRSGDSFTMGAGKLTVIGPDGIGYPILFRNLDRVSIDNVRADGGQVAALSIEDCFGVSGKNVVARQIDDTFDGYGIAIGNSQDVRIWGSAYGHFNGFVVGGGPTAGGKVGMNRDIHFDGIGGSDPVTGLSGANVHGNAEYCSFRGVFYNGVTIAGNWNEAHGTFIKSGSPAVLFGEMHGHDFRVTGEVRITSGPDLSDSVGAIHMWDYGQNSEGPGGASTARYGGVGEIDVVFRAPKASRMMLWRTLNLARTDVILKLGLDIVEAHPTTRIIVIDANGDTTPVPVLDFTRLNIRDNAVAITWSILSSTYMKIRGLRRSKMVNVTGTGVASASANATFDPAFPRTPLLTAAIASASFSGAAPLACGITPSGASGGIVTVVTTDKTSVNLNTNVAVTASLDEE